MLDEQLVFHQELDVRTVETTEIENIFGQLGTHKRQSGSSPEGFLHGVLVLHPESPGVAPTAPTASPSSDLESRGQGEVRGGPGGGRADGEQEHQEEAQQEITGAGGAEGAEGGAGGAGGHVRCPAITVGQARLGRPGLTVTLLSLSDLITTD